ncbi:MAG: orange carotenoid protein N-terminal domain-containing protein [Nodosilinea sp.]
MTSSQPDTTQITAQSTQELFQRYDALTVDDKLALLYYIYEAMGSSITPAAPGAADIDLTQPLIAELFDRSEEEQLEVMRSIVKGEDTPLSRSYGGFSANNQLLVWYAWAEAMGDSVVDMPKDYKAASGANEILDILAVVKQLDFQAQISFLREAATQMGYSAVGAPPTQAETGKTDSL